MIVNIYEINKNGEPEEFEKYEVQEFNGYVALLIMQELDLGFETDFSKSYQLECNGDKITLPPIKGWNLRDR